MTAITYNYIYSKIVQNNTDLIGFVAYSLYKQEKIEFIKTTVSNTRVEPTDAEMNIFHASTNTDIRIKSYRDQAEKILADFSTQILSTEAAKMQEEYDAQLVAELKQSRPFWRGVSENIVSSFVSLGMIAFILVIIWSQSIGVKEVAGQIFNVDITSKPAAIPSGGK